LAKSLCEMTLQGHSFLSSSAGCVLSAGDISTGISGVGFSGGVGAAI
jgi:hypothetical protein